MIPSYFDKIQINDPDNAFEKEFLITSQKGLYATSSLCGSNQRKYHGLLIAPQPQINDDDYVFLSAINESVIAGDQKYDLDMHQYTGITQPTGYKYLQEFFGSPMPKWLFCMGDVTLSKELLLSEHEEGIMIRYQLQDASGPVTLSLNPLLPFRSAHNLGKSGVALCKKTVAITNGVKLMPQAGCSDLFLVISNKAVFINAPDWYYNIEYPIEKKRGYECREDLFTPGAFKITIRKGDSVILYAGFKEIKSKNIKAHFRYLQKNNHELNTMQQCMAHAASQFILKKNKTIRIKAGYPWFGCWGRDSFISLAGLTLVPGHIKTFEAIVAAMLPDLKKGLFPNVGSGRNAGYNAADASLWFIRAIQQYAAYTRRPGEIWLKYGTPMKSILDHYAKGTLFNIGMDKDGLVKAGAAGTALTWMDCIIDGKAVTPRAGKPVEINALWYNAICFCLEAATAAGDTAFVKKWKNLPGKISNSFMASFIAPDREYIADCVTDEYTDWSIRPNQVIALSLPYSPVSGSIRKSALNIVKEELLTPRGLRTLSPKDPKYRGSYSGDQSSRDRAYHQGTVWPWLTGCFAEAWLKEYREEAIDFLERLYRGFETALQELCLYTIPEVYNGDAPHVPGGAISQAWSVAELLRMDNLIRTYKHNYLQTPKADAI